MSLFKGKALFWIAALVICAADLWTKTLVFDRLGVDPDAFATMDEFRHSRHPTEAVMGDTVRFVAMFNPGMMWGKFSQYSNVLLYLRLGAVLVILYLVRGVLPGQWGALLALGGILGGAIGNIYDSLRYIGVRDFFEVDFNVAFFDPFPAFNLADSAICVGVALLALGMVLKGDAQEAESHEPKAAS